MSANGANGSNGANGHGNSNGDGKKHQPLNHWANDPRWSASRVLILYSDVVRLRAPSRSSTRSRVLARSASGT